MGLEEIRRRLMTDSQLYNLNEGDPKFGPVPGYPVGSTFKTRKDCSLAGVHIANYAGIAGSQNGAYSICISGGYEDDRDDGETVVYTGTGGQENSFSGNGSGNQIKDQTFEHKDNYALKRSCETKRPVRVIRGQNAKSKYAPSEGYRYDGLYRVENAYLDKGKSGYLVCRYHLRVAGAAAIEGQTLLGHQLDWTEVIVANSCF